MPIWSSPREFILLWNSQQRTPSPKSIREAPALDFTTLPAVAFSSAREERSRSGL